DLCLQLNRGSHPSPSNASITPNGFVARPENWRGCWPGVLCHRIDHDLCLAITAAKTLGDRYRLSPRRLHYHGRHFVGLALAFFILTVIRFRGRNLVLTAQQFFTRIRSAE